MQTLIEENIVEKFQEQGYVIIRDFFSPEEMNDLIEEISSTKPRHGSSCLTKGTMTFYSEVFFNNQKIQNFISQQKVVDFLKQVIGPDFWVRWDQAVAKRPGSGIFPWHQDNGYSRLKDEYYQLWISLTDGTPENGGLWLVPGSHKEFLPHKEVENHVAYEGTPDNPISIQTKAGDIVLFSSLMLHKTTPNITQGTRWAYVIEYMSLNHLDPTVEAPYFVVARDGKSHPEFVQSYPGQFNLINQIKYLDIRLKQLKYFLFTRHQKN